MLVFVIGETLRQILVWIKPRLGLSFFNKLGCPSALFAMPSKGPVIYPAPFLLILINHERSSFDARSLFHRK